MTPKNSLRAVNRRARQNKAPKGQRIPSESRRVTSKTWSFAYEGTPNGNTMVADNGIFRMSQTQDYGSVITSSAGGQVFIAQKFAFSDLPQVTSFQAIFDQYKIEALEIWITPSSTTSPSVLPSQYVAVVDYDEATNPSSFAQLLQYQNVNEVPFTNGVYYHFTPHTGMSIGAPGTFGGAGNITAPWIDSASPSTPHYGIKIGMYASAVTVSLQIRARFHMAFRNLF